MLFVNQTVVGATLYVGSAVAFWRIGLLADGLLADVEPISGGAGWVGAGLLGAVLAWLFIKHLPAKDAQLNEFVKEKDRQLGVLVEHAEELLSKKDERIDTQRAEFLRALNEMTASFRAETVAERQACERHFATLAESMNGAFRTLTEQLQTHSARNQQWLDLLKSQIEAEKAKQTKQITG